MNQYLAWHTLQLLIMDRFVHSLANTEKEWEIVRREFFKWGVESKNFDLWYEIIR